MRRAAVIIGVDKTGTLPILNAAAKGANDFAKWANKQGIDVTLLTDSNSKTVSVADISTAINKYVDTQVYEQLIIYFSGHGILRSPEYELWLLSGSPENPNEAVNLPGSILMARNTRIKHVVFISDACRSLPSSSRLFQVTGSIVFPNEVPKSPRPTIDIFYATLPGDTALELPITEAVANYRGIFTDCILKGLNGSVSQVIVEVGQEPRLQRVVPAWELKIYLESEIPIAVSSIDIKLQQEPDIRVESHHPPSFLALLSDENIGESIPFKPTNPITEADQQNLTNRQALEYLKSTINSNLLTTGEETSLVLKNPKIIKFSESIDKVYNTQAKGPERKTGFNVFGSKIESVAVSQNESISFYENFISIDNIQSGLKRSNSVLIEFSNGTGVLLAILPCFIGTVFIQDSQVVTVNYTLSEYEIRSRNTRYTPADDQYNRNGEEKNALNRAFAAVAARNGLIQLSRDLPLLPTYEVKSLDPTIILYTTYAHVQSGRIDDIQSVTTGRLVSTKTFGPIYFPVLFDHALFKGALLKHDTVPIAPACPLLTQGWAFMGPYYEFLNSAVLDSSKHLLPGLWTTFSKEGVSILKRALAEGKIL